MNTKYMPREAMTGCVGRINVNLDDMDKYPDAKYWMGGALWVMEKIQEACKDPDRIGEIADRYFWKKENTWMYICIEAEHMFNVIKALQGKKQLNGKQ